MKRLLRFGALAVLLAACNGDQNKPVVSVDQAKQITADMRGQTSFVPPPRTITDVTALLDQFKPDPQRVAELRELVQAPPASGLSGTRLYQFYLNRAQAAGELGLGRQQLADAREAVRIARESRTDAIRGIQEQMLAEAFNGNTRSALQLALGSLREAESNNRGGAVVTANSLIASHRASLGDVSGAEQAIAAAENQLSLPGMQRSPVYGPMYPEWLATIQRAKAELAMLTGRDTIAETELRRAIQNAQFMQKNIDRAIAVVPDFPRTAPQRNEIVYTGRLSLALRNQGRLAEAEGAIRHALRLALELYGKDSARTAAMLTQFGATVAAQGRWPEAIKLAEMALEIYAMLGIEKDSRFVAIAHSLRASSLGAMRDRAASLAAWQKALDVYVDDPESRFREIESRPNYLLSLVNSPRAAAAIPLIERVVAERRQRLGERNYETAEARGILAAALNRTGDTARALAEFRAALPVLLQASRQAEDGSPADRDRRLQRILESYMDMLARLQPGEVTGLDPAADSFLVADAARARGVQRALAESAARANVRDPALADLVRREQDAQKQVSALFGLYNNALAGPAEQQDPDALLKLRTQIDQLRDARAAFRGEIERRFPDYANLIDPRPASIAEVQAGLRPGEAMLVTYVGQDRTFVWAVPQQGTAAFAAPQIGEQEIGRMVGDLRKALDPNAATLGDIPDFNVAGSHDLYQKLVAPVAAGLRGATSYIVVTDKALGQLPFGLLVTEAPQPVQDGSGALFSGYKRVPFLIRQAAIVQLPSVASLATLRKVPPAVASRRAFAGFGDPWFSEEQAKQARADTSPPVQTASLTTRGRPLVRRSAPRADIDSAELAQLPRLPDTADEIRSIALALRADPAQDVFIGSRATERMVKTTDLANRKVVAFATHGLVPGDLNGLSQPALALTAPAVGDGDGDGLLTMEEILGLRLDADWVVLSACNTGAGEGAGAEAASGLGRAFFYAGTRAVLLTNWPVETNSARTLTTDLFRRQAENPTLSRARAMQQSMLALLDGDGQVEGGRTVFSYAHPIFWAPFSVVGDPGGSPAS